MTAALAKGDLQASRDAYEAYDAVWNGVEVYVNVRSVSLYLKLEIDLQFAIDDVLASEGPYDFPALQAMSEELGTLYEEAVALSKAGPPLSPLFDDVTALRVIRADLRIVGFALEAGNVEKAAEYFAKFAEGFNDAYPLLKMRDEANAEATEHAVDAAVEAFANKASTAEDLAKLTAKVTSEYNFGVSLWNAAARNADEAKTEVTTNDLLRLTYLHDVRIQLIKSMKAWTAGDFDKAGSVAVVAGTTAFNRVLGALADKAPADATLKKLIDTYATLAAAAGDAKAVGDANLAAIRGVAVAEQVLLGAFWTTDQVQDYLAGRTAVDPLT